MSELCKWLHEQLECLPLFRYPFEPSKLPKDGIYFFYEKGEIWGHGGDKQRIVRIGTSREGNFRSRINEHFLMKSSKGLDKDKLKPSDRSIFRKNIGRALLNRCNDPYLDIWNHDFTYLTKRERHGDERDIDKEERIESEITKILRTNFSFRFIVIDNGTDRDRLEKLLIGTVANCGLCKPSADWLGKYSPKPKIKEKGMWLEQNLSSHPISGSNKVEIMDLIHKTKSFIP